ncbi:MAG: TipAS antibiotic-recognition domain-containing protein [Streptococcaceae bacterium]|nr:TipAS antibiotic-recognition domain-containing protein [Streptococcaceae bacterium]MCL2681011.1 TipAS antibiotic-recognition domain-containing protein [Streptococcaceae bacterium]MCL2858351.1 TipAS antibiotic-recognition domain-containing protein [Streptococcaceae bacterium]
MKNIKEVTKLTGLTSKALRHWEKEGLLTPRRDENDYRLYSDSDLTDIFYIQSLRQLDLSLTAIKNIRNQSTSEKEVFIQHLQVLKTQQIHLSQLINQLETKLTKEEYIMKDKDFQLLKENKIKENEEKYGQEIRENYGYEAVQDSNDKFKNQSQEDIQWAEDTHQKIIRLLETSYEKQDKNLAQEAIELHKTWIEHYWDRPLTPEGHRGLAQLYTEDDRFRANYEQNIKGLADYFSKEIDDFYK